MVLKGFSGKIPAKGDFVSRGLPASFTEPWHDWASDALHHSRSLLGDGWTDAWVVAPVWRFALPAGACGPDAVLGLMLPSIDRLGRAWPLMLGVVFRGEATIPKHAEYETFLDEAEQVARQAVAEDTEPDILTVQIGDLPLPPFQPSEKQTGRWWTSGAPRVEPQILEFPGLPALPGHAALLAGGDVK